MIRAMISDLDGILVQTGQRCVAVITSFTRRRIYAERVLHARGIVDDPGTLSAVVRQMVAEQEKGNVSVCWGNDEIPSCGLLVEQIRQDWKARDFASAQGNGRRSAPAY